MGLRTAGISSCLLLVLVSAYVCQVDTRLPIARVPCKYGVSWQGLRLGNIVFHAFYVLHAGRILETEVVLDDYVIEQARDFFKVNKNGALVWDFRTANTTCEGEFLFSLWDGDDPKPTYVPTDYQARELGCKYVYPALNWREDRPASDELVVYLRSGDVVRRDADVTFCYTQAPCAFIDKAVELSGLRKVVIVTDINAAKDEVHPCLDQAIAKHDARVFSKSVSADFTYIVHATNLVITGITSFGESPIFLSPTLKNLFVPSFLVTNAKHKTTYYTHLRSYEWLNVTQLVMRDWPDEAWHRDVLPTLTTYPAEKIDVKGPHKWFPETTSLSPEVIPTHTSTFIYDRCTVPSAKSLVKVLHKHRGVSRHEKWYAAPILLVGNLSYTIRLPTFDEDLNMGLAHLETDGETWDCGRVVAVRHLVSVARTIENTFNTSHFIWMLDPALQFDEFIVVHRNVLIRRYPDSIVLFRFRHGRHIRAVGVPFAFRDDPAILQALEQQYGELELTKFCSQGSTTMLMCAAVDMMITSQRPYGETDLVPGYPS